MKNILLFCKNGFVLLSECTVLHAALMLLSQIYCLLKPFEATLKKVVIFKLFYIIFLRFVAIS